MKVVFAAMSPGIESLLGAHGVIRRSAVQGPNRDFEDADIVIATADEALGKKNEFGLETVGL